MLSTGPHTRTISTSVCVPKHADRSASKRTGGDWLVLHCCGITGTYSMYMWRLNSVVKKKGKSVSKMWFWAMRWKCSCGCSSHTLRRRRSSACMRSFPVRCSCICACVKAQWERFRREPVPMWILCTVATLWCQVRKNIVTSGVNKQYLCQMELNIYLWSTSIIWKRQLFCKALISVLYPSSAARNNKHTLCKMCAPSFSLHQTASSFFFYSCCQILIPLSVHINKLPHWS